ncbi:unnamed protein product [Vitrella brassicaformis CCMP3155]|uniref:Uncharacterized protein n=1 Tax=Vitrella brassicaformis (strain CCMP3155) TaxID=1169540 RepID=A0A0G4FNZ0_VITBC|nr:unnamed protein product [Vitrella brassicaformis CCMP3155]|eukprot:CEM15940.1 unnamed protein product [Vitrella brassicaformis CCMP3155]
MSRAEPHRGFQQGGRGESVSYGRRPQIWRPTHHHHQQQQQCLLRPVFRGRQLPPPGGLSLSNHVSNLRQLRPVVGDEGPEPAAEEESEDGEEDDEEAESGEEEGDSQAGERQEGGAIEGQDDGVVHDDVREECVGFVVEDGRLFERCRAAGQEHPGSPSPPSTAAGQDDASDGSSPLLPLAASSDAGSAQMPLALAHSPSAAGAQPAPQEAMSEESRAILAAFQPAGRYMVRPVGETPRYGVIEGHCEGRRVVLKAVVPDAIRRVDEARRAQLG